MAKDVRIIRSPDSGILSLYDLRGIIYLIECWVDGKCYVGQTVKTFAKRYGGLGLWWHFTHSKPLNAALDKHGPAGFRVRILEHSKTPEELNRLEPLYAEQYNSYWPHGYNVQRCGGNESALNRHPNIADLEPGDISAPDRTIHHVSDWIRFCVDHGLDKYRIWKIMTKRADAEHGWTRPETAKKTHHNDGSYLFYERDGTRHEVNGLSAFCREKGLIYRGLMAVVAKKAYESQGYALSVEAFGKRMKKSIVTLTKDGKEIVLTSIKKDCRAHGLHSRYVYDLKNGRLESHMGWRFVKAEEVELYRTTH